MCVCVSMDFVFDFYYDESDIQNKMCVFFLILFILCWIYFDFRIGNKSNTNTKNWLCRFGWLMYKWWRNRKLFDIKKNSGWVHQNDMNLYINVYYIKVRINMNSIEIQLIYMRVQWSFLLESTQFNNILNRHWVASHKWQCEILHA